MLNSIECTEKKVDSLLDKLVALEINKTAVNYKESL